MNKLGSDCEEAESAEDMKSKMTGEEWESVYKMSQDKNLYSNLITSLFPTIHGNDEVKRGIMLMLFGECPRPPPAAPASGATSTCAWWATPAQPSLSSSRWCPTSPPELCTPVVRPAVRLV